MPRRNHRGWESIMIISLIKCIDGNETRYKYLPLEYCCDKMRLNPMLDLTDDHNNDSNVFCFECEEGRWNPFLPEDVCKTCGCNGNDESCDLPRMKMIRSVYDYDDFPNDESVSIMYCPHCGEKIDVSVAGEIDITNLVKELEEKYIAAKEKYDQCDSIKQRNILYKEMQKAANEYDEIFEFGEFKYNKEEIKWHDDI